MYCTHKVTRFEKERPGYCLTREQEALFGTLIKAIEKMTSEDDRNREARNQEDIDIKLDKIDRLCLTLIITLLDHQFGDDEYESVIISGLAVLGIRDDRGWLNAED